MATSTAPRSRAAWTCSSSSQRPPLAERDRRGQVGAFDISTPRTSRRSSGRRRSRSRARISISWDAKTACQRGNAPRWPTVSRRRRSRAPAHAGRRSRHWRRRSTATRRPRVMPLACGCSRPRFGGSRQRDARSSVRRAPDPLTARGGQSVNRQPRPVAVHRDWPRALFPTA